MRLVSKINLNDDGVGSTQWKDRVAFERFLEHYSLDGVNVRKNVGNR